MATNDYNNQNYSVGSSGAIAMNSRAEDAQQVEAIQFGGTRKVSRDDVIYFSTQLAVMVDTGITLPEALDSIESQTEHTGLKKILKELSTEVRGGIEFSAALEKHEKTFGTLFISLVKSSEVSGSMGAMLQRASRYLQQERDTIKRIKGAMTYPVCMFSFCVVIIICLLIFILPRFEKIYAGKGAILPAPTRILLSLSNGLINYWPYLIAILAAGIIGGFMFFRSPTGRFYLHTMRIKLPLIGKMYRKAYLSRSLRSMSTMLTCGVGILEGLEITAQVAGNDIYKNMWSDVGESVQQGQPLSEHLFATDLIPNSVAQMIQAGEKSGRISEVMDRVAEFCEEDLKVAVKACTDLIEPIMIVIMGLVVGGIAMALLLPVFKLSKVMAG